MDASGKSQTFYEDTTAFGTMLSSAGTGTTPFKFGGGNGCQTDADTQMVLMGHRYYDSRTGRFLTQDPAGDGDNWYAYVGNNPTNEIDPLGLWCPIPNVGENFAANRIAASEAFANMGLSLSSNLDTKYKFYDVNKVTWNKSTGQIISSVYQFTFAIPIGVNLAQNYQKAYSDRRGDASYKKSVTEAYFMGSKGNGIGEGTTGDFKNPKKYPLPSGLPSRVQNQLIKLLDHGGNFNGGIVAEGYGTFASESELIGGYAKYESTGHVQLDDRTGQGIFQVGWIYGHNMDPSAW